MLPGETSQQDRWFAEACTTDCGGEGKTGGDWPQGQRKLFVETRSRELHIQK